MSQHEQFRRTAIARGIPEDEVSTFAEFLRFAIWTSGLPAGEPVGQLGGLPRLPVGMEWPAGPLPFVASFDCAALPQADGLALPADGSLLFFLHHENAYDAGLGGSSVAEEQNYARVVYVPAGVDTAPAEKPDNTENMFYDSTREFVQPERELFATVAAELPSWFDDEDEDLDGNPRSRDQEHLALHLPHLVELCALTEELWPQGNGATVYLGGYSMDVGGTRTGYLYVTPETDMADRVLKARKKAGETVPTSWRERYVRTEKEALKVMREWVPLAQFVPDDVYRGRFLIRHDDLAAGRLDKALSITGFTE